MLMLTRRYKESVIINDDIKIIVLGINRNQVRLGFEAPVVNVNLSEVSLSN